MLFTLFANGFYFGVNGNFGGLHKGPRKFGPSSALSSDNKFKKDFEEELKKKFNVDLTLDDFLSKTGIDLARASAAVSTNAEEKEMAMTVLDNAEKTLEQLGKWSNFFNWSVGCGLGYRFMLSQKWFLDWGFFDFSKGFSFFTNFRVGKIYSDKWSFYGSVSPCVLMSTNLKDLYGIYRIYKSKRTIPEKTTTLSSGGFRWEAARKEPFTTQDVNAIFKSFGYTFPFIGLGFGLGAGASYRLSPRTSFVAEYNVQISYLDGYYAAYALAKRWAKDVKGLDDIKELEPIFKPFLSSRTIRQRISLGIEFHSSARDE
ncbi:MAG: hypothetical protein H6850_01250 [Alphaproteobacteria bacterium]|nr:MAG: hypothetical protein H6850_01250 [Alphaproteobacteria bacterium]